MFIKTKQPRNRGASILETLVACAIGVLAISMLMGSTFYTGRSLASLTDSVNLGGQSRSVVDRMSQKIRQADDVTAFSTNSVTVLVGGTNLTYTYQPDTKQLLE